MRSGGNSLNYFPKNKLTELANLVQFESMLIFCLEDWWAWAPWAFRCLHHCLGLRRQSWDCNQQLYIITVNAECLLWQARHLESCCLLFRFILRSFYPIYQLGNFVEKFLSVIFPEKLQH